VAQYPKTPMVHVRNPYDRPDFVKLRFEVESMRHGIVRQLSEHEGLIQEAVKNSVDRFFEGENWLREIEISVRNECLQVLQRAIRDVVTQLVTQPDIQEVLKQAVLGGLREQMARAVEDALQR